MKKLITIFSLLAIMLFSISTAFAANEKITMMDEDYKFKKISIHWLFIHQATNLPH